MSFWDLEADEAWENALPVFCLFVVDCCTNNLQKLRVAFVHFSCSHLGGKKKPKQTHKPVYCLESDDLSMELSHLTYLNLKQ